MVDWTESKMPENGRLRKRLKRDDASRSILPGADESGEKQLG
ncbi:hypothetical protein CLOM621_08946 [Clostridium sp. M62/1]|nr:hypothetical protein [Clostridium sp. M62/1]EFE10860.1 hypothetical protein CLOM621_08946 [Clostridium sp. M62/1]